MSIPTPFNSATVPANNPVTPMTPREFQDNPVVLLYISMQKQSDQIEQLVNTSRTNAANITDLVQAVQLLRTSVEVLRAEHAALATRVAQIEQERNNEQGQYNNRVFTKTQNLIFYGLQLGMMAIAFVSLLFAYLHK